MLNGSIPEEIYSLLKLQVLDLSNNRLTGNLSPKLGQLVNVKKLNLGHNAITGPIPSQIDQLTKLESLNLNYNALNGQFPSSMAPPALGYCYMTPNQFQSCQDLSIVNNPQSLAFQCSVDCVVKTNKKKNSAAANQVNISVLALTILMAAVGLFM
ncbi:hypothetical protein MBANPS3_003416 [Mucor bainieri]